MKAERCYENLCLPSRRLKKKNYLTPRKDGDLKSLPSCQVILDGWIKDFRKGYIK